MAAASRHAHLVVGLDWGQGTGEYPFSLPLIAYRSPLVSGVARQMAAWTDLLRVKTGSVAGRLMALVQLGFFCCFPQKSTGLFDTGHGRCTLPQDLDFATNIGSFQSPWRYGSESRSEQMLSFCRSLYRSTLYGASRIDTPALDPVSPAPMATLTRRTGA